MDALRPTFADALREAALARTAPGRSSVVLTRVGQSAWVVTYVLALGVGWFEKVPGIPIVAILLNTAWELQFGLLDPPSDRVVRRMYRVWFWLDLCLLVQLWWNVPPPEVPAFMRDSFGAFLILGLGSAVASIRLVNSRLRHPTRLAFTLNLLMSALFVHLWYARPGHEGSWLSLALLKAVGTASISGANVLHWKRQRTLDGLGLSLMLGIFVLDLWYVWLCW